MKSTSISGAFKGSAGRGFWVGPNLDCWKPVLEEWLLVNERYCRFCKGDSIYWSKERANVGALAAAAWRAGWVAIEEFAQAKTRRERPGRADLYLGCAEVEAYLEAKFGWLHPSTRDAGVERLQSTLAWACSNAERCKVPEGENAKRAGIYFGCVAIRRRYAEKLEGGLERLFAGLQSVRPDLCAWCFPPEARELTVGSDKFFHPGVVLVAQFLRDEK